MRGYGSVHTCFWSNTEIQRLCDQAKLLALYLLTGPHTNMLGCFRLPVGYVAEDLKWSSETVSKRLGELSKLGFIKRDIQFDWVLISRFLEWNPIENPNQGKSICKLFGQIPPKCKLYEHVIKILLTHHKHFDEGFQNRLKTLSKPLVKEFRNQEQDQKQDQGQNQEQDACAVLSGESPTPSTDDFVITLPLLDKTEFVITKTQLAEWQNLYPAVDVIQTLRHIRGWNLANKKHQKTQSGILRHVTQWLAKEQNRTSPSQLKTFNPSNNKNLYEHNCAVGQQWIEAGSTNPESSGSQ